MSSGLPRNFTLCRRCSWLTMLITGDCSKSIRSAWFSVVSNTGSPVWFTKFARIIESLSSFGALAAVPTLVTGPTAVAVVAGRL